MGFGFFYLILGVLFREKNYVALYINYLKHESSIRNPR